MSDVSRVRVELELDAELVEKMEAAALAEQLTLEEFLAKCAADGMQAFFGKSY